MIRYLALTLLLLAGPAGAAMYKWTDDEGNVHYSQTPPPDRKSKSIAPPPKVVPPPASRKDSPGAEEEAADEAAPAGKGDAMRAQVYRRNCEAARGNLELYQSNTAIKEGSQVVKLDEKERKRRIEETRQQIKLYCGQ